MWSKEKSVETHLSSASGSVETTLLAKCALSRDDERLEFYDNYLQLIPNYWSIIVNYHRRECCC